MRRILALGAASAIVVGAFALASDGRWPWRRLPPARPAPIPLRTWITHDTLRPGESLAELFGRHGLGPADLGALVERLRLDPRRLRAGLEFRFGHHEAAPGVTDVTYRSATDEEIRAVRSPSDWTAERRPIRWFRRSLRVEGTITSSLVEAVEEAAASEPLTAEERIRLAWYLADVFAWQVDFTRDIQPNDRFAVVLERERSERGEERLGGILAGELTVATKVFTAFRYQADGGRGRPQFFDQAGASLRRAFLRSPVEFRRISSRFSRSRFHPILQVRRSHQGIDYSAASGTPVQAAGEGQVVSAGWSGGYGRMIELRHRNGITTRYAHLRSFARGVRPGRRVHQGEVIGFVGSSGLSTAPHLHYEFRQHGSARDPARVDLGSGDPIPPAHYQSFVAERRRLESLLRPSPNPLAPSASD